MPHAAPKADATLGRPPRPPTHDAAMPAARDPLMWVLVQTAPLTKVLAISKSRNRLVIEMAELDDCEADRDHPEGCRFAIEPANVLFG